MAAYIVGMVVGGIVTVFPLIYMMNFDRCVAMILEEQPQFDVAAFTPSYSPVLATGITIIGAVVLLISAGMMAFTGFGQLNTNSDNESETSTQPGTGKKTKPEEHTSSEPETKTNVFSNEDDETDTDSSL